MTNKLDRRTIYPVEGRTVRAPELSYLPLPPEGLEVIWSMHWQQQLNFGDITLDKPKAKVEELAAPEAEPEPEPAKERSPKKS